MQKILFFLLCLAFLPVTALAQDDGDDVIMGYKLGMHLDSIPKQNLLKMGRFQKLYRYDRQDEGLSMDGIRLEWVRLFIWDNHLHSIEVKTLGTDGDNFKGFLKAKYGEGERKDAMGYAYQWFLPTMRVLWDQNLATKEGVAQFVDEATHNKYYMFIYQQQNRER